MINRTEDFMKLSTQIVTPEGILVQPYAKLKECRKVAGKDYYEIDLYIKLPQQEKSNPAELLVGFIQYQVSPERIFILYRENWDKKYKHVGSALGEYVFRDSIRRGLHGRIYSGATYDAQVFHYIWGLRIIPEEAKIFLLPLETSVEEEFRDLCLEYLEDEDAETRDEILRDYSSQYEKLRSVVEQKTKASNLSFAEVMSKALVDLNQELATAVDEIRNRKNASYKRNNYGQRTMHLTDEMIARKIQEYAISKEMTQTIMANSQPDNNIQTANQVATSLTDFAIWEPAKQFIEEKIGFIKSFINKQK